MDKHKKKVGILTFHASHNYGSCLQAYALQNTVKSLGMDVEIINFRTFRQKDMYAVFTKRKGLKYLLKNLTHLLYYFPLKQKYQKFEDFIANNYLLSAQEYASAEDLQEAEANYDAFIVGSDQVWNPLPRDFDWIYFLTFVKEKKKISYAPSFGPFFGKANEETLKRVAAEVETFSSISVREMQAKADLEQYINREINVVLDPTLLLEWNEWKELIDPEPIIKEDYIFLYTLFSSSEINRIVKKLSKKWKMRVVVSNFSNQHDVFTSYTKCFGTGPKDFLNLIYHAKFVVVTSFHGTVFSTLFEKPFYAINGEKDNRIFSLLNITGLTNRTININDIEEKAEQAFNIDFSEAREKIRQERVRSIEYLRHALEK